MVLKMSLLTGTYFLFLLLTTILAIGNWVPVIPAFFMFAILSITTASTPLQLAWTQRNAYRRITLIHIFNVIFTIAIYSVIYFRNGLVVDGKHQTIGLIDAFNFSCTTWTTLGYGKFTPTPDLLIITSLEALHGVFAMAIFIAVIAMYLNDAVKTYDNYLYKLVSTKPEELNYNENENQSN